MDKSLRSILWVLIALVLLSSFSTGWFFVAKEKLRNEYVNLEALFKTSVERLDRELASSNKENMELKSRLEIVQKELSVLESKNKVLESQYKGLLEERDDLDKKFGRIKKDKFFLEKRLKEMESPKDLEIGKLKRDIMDSDLTLSELKEEKDLLEQKLEDSTNIAEILSSDLLKEKDRSKGYQRESENIDKENRFLKAKLSEFENTSDKVSKLLAEKENMQLTLSGIRKDLEYKNVEIDKLKAAFRHKAKEVEELRAEAYHSPQEVELPPIILQREDPGRGAFKSSSPLGKISGGGALRGRILSVNREHNFVVIDLGKQDKINVGSNLDVYRNNTLIGSIEVIQVRERIAACDIIDAKEGFKIDKDDVIIKR